MDEATAVFILRRIAPHFMAIVTEEAKTLPDTDGQLLYVVVCFFLAWQPLTTNI